MITHTVTLKLNEAHYLKDHLAMIRHTIQTGLLENDIDPDTDHELSSMLDLSTTIINQLDHQSKL
jgi:hypothetical protein